MRRLLGAALVVAGCGALGFIGAARLDGRVRDLDELAAGLAALGRELGWALTPLPQALEAAARTARGPAADFFARCGKGAGRADSAPFWDVWRSELDRAPLRLDREDRAVLNRLGPVLGRYDGDSQRLALEETSAGLRALRARAEEDRRRLGRVYSVLGVSSGLLLAILLL